MIDKEFLKLLISSTDNISSAVTANFKAEYLDLDVQGFSPVRELYVTVISFFSKFKSTIPMEQLESFLVSRSYTPEKIKEILLVYNEVSQIVTIEKNFEFFIQELKRLAAMKTLNTHLDAGADAIVSQRSTVLSWRGRLPSK